jgi:anti-sigma B factor antagonist
MNISAHDDGDGVRRLALAGDLDLATAGLLDQHVDQALAGTVPRRLVVDAARLRFCDSSGIHAIIRARDAAHRRGAAFVLSNPVGIARRALEITGLLAPLTAVSHGPGA